MLDRICTARFVLVDIPEDRQVTQDEGRYRIEGPCCNAWIVVCGVGVCRQWLPGCFSVWYTHTHFVLQVCILPRSPSSCEYILQLSLLWVKNNISIALHSSVNGITGAILLYLRDRFYRMLPLPLSQWQINNHSICWRNGALTKHKKRYMILLQLVNRFTDYLEVFTHFFTRSHRFSALLTRTIPVYSLQWLSGGSKAVQAALISCIFQC